MYRVREFRSGAVQRIAPEIIQRARGGDGEAWEALVQTHQQAAFRLAYLLLADSGEAEDVAQEAFLRAYRAMDRFDETRPFRPWLLRITANLARNRKRSLGRYWHALARAARRDPDSFAEARAWDPNDHGSLQAARLWQAVRRLSEKDQRVVYLRYFLDYSEAEMAETLEIARGMVKSRLHRALGRLRSVIDRDFPDLDEGRTR